MKEINYIILAHKHPEQVKRLVQSLYTDQSFFYIHVDKNSNIELFLEALHGMEKVSFLKDEQRKSGTWGDIGIVEATINALTQILIDNKKGYCVLLSGQDYPIHDASYIETFLAENYGTNFLTYWKMPHKDWVMQGGMDRLTLYKTNLTRDKGNYILLPSIFDRRFYKIETFRNVLSVIKFRQFGFLLNLLKKRNFIQGIEPYGGWQWWALPVETVKLITDFIKKNPQFLSFYRYSLLPDEMVFQTAFMHVLGSKPGISIKENLTFLVWDSINTCSPKIFTSNDLSAISGIKDKLFARKFDVEEDAEILNLIDIQKLSRKQQILS